MDKHFDLRKNDCERNRQIEESKKRQRAIADRILARMKPKKE